jgi:hypothetical protein
MEFTSFMAYLSIVRYSGDPKTGHSNTGNIKKQDKFVRFLNGLVAIFLAIQKPVNIFEFGPTKICLI